MTVTAVVKKPFPYAADGVSIVELEEGSVHAFPERLFEGLARAGYVEAAPAETAEPKPKLGRRR